MCRILMRLKGKYTEANISIGHKHTGGTLQSQTSNLIATGCPFLIEHIDCIASFSSLRLYVIFFT